MYNFYIQNYTDNEGTFHSDETLAYKIPYEGSVDAMFIDPVIKNEMGKAGSFEFSVEPFNLYYKSWHQMRTILRVEYEKETIFRGRVLTIDDTFLGQRKIHCEGDLAFLLDSMQEGVKEEKRKDITLENYLESLIASHNSQMSNETYKYFQLGQVPGKYTATIDEAQKIKNDTQKFGSDAWETTMSAFERIRKECGGFFRTRYVAKKDGTGTCYIDWLESYFRKSETEQTIEVGENLIDINYNTEVNNIFTALIPIGSKGGEELTIKGYKTNIHGDNNYILVPQLTQVFSSEELKTGYHTKSDYKNAVDNYGIIFKVQKFQNADTQEKLWNYATDWMKNNYYGGMTSFDVSAVDLHHVDDEEQQFLVGDQVPLIFPDMEKTTDDKYSVNTRTLTITQATYYPYSPEKGQYSIGIPNSAMEKTYGNASNKKGGGGKPPTDDGDFWDDMRRKANADYVWARVNDIIWDAYINSDAYQRYVAKVGGDKAVKTVLAPAAFAVHSYLEPPLGLPQKLPSVLIQDNSISIMPGTVFQKSNAQAFSELPPEQQAAWKGIIIDGWENKLTLYQRRQIEDPSSLQNLRPPTPIGDIMADPLKGLRLSGYEPDKGPEDPGDTRKTFELSSLEGIMKIAKMLIGENANDFTLNPNLKDKDGNIIPEELQNDAVKAFLDFKGRFFSGKTPSNPSKPVEGDNKWMVRINDTVTYKDKDGNTQTKSGFISVEDLKLPNIDSFQTKMAAIDTLTTKVLTTDNLSANAAKIAGCLVGRDVTVGTLRTLNFQFNGSNATWKKITTEADGDVWVIAIR